jgi:hypothetical protein
MTPEEWEGCADLESMLTVLETRARARRQRLFCCACGRRVWDSLSAEDRAAVELSERAADGSISEAEQQRLHELRQKPLVVLRGDLLWPMRLSAAASPGESARLAATDLVQALSWTQADEARALALAETAVGWGERSREAVLAERVDVAEAAAIWADARLARRQAVDRIRARGIAMAQPGQQQAVCLLVREVLGNPFRPPPTVPDVVLAHNGGAARRLAEAIYDGRRFEDLPVLADLLEEAGCTDAALLGHLRGPGTHALGCWALDAILGK